MVQIHPKIVEYLATIDLQNVDDRLVYNREAKVAYWFHTFMYDEMLRSGRELTGYVFRHYLHETLLVVKAKQNGTQGVVYCTAKNSISCMETFCRKFYAGTLAWKEDKYA